jgi:hypothetical protein
LVCGDLNAVFFPSLPAMLSLRELQYIVGTHEIDPLYIHGYPSSSLKCRLIFIISK